MRVNAPLMALNRGECSKLALARVDLAKLQLAAECQLNWMPWVMGAMMLRPGLNYVGEVDGDNPAWLIDFIYSKTDTALLELTANKLRVWINDALLTRVAVSTTVLDPTFTGTGSHWTTSDTTDGCTATVTGGVATLTASARGGLSRIKQTLTIAAPDQNVEHALRVVVTDGPVTIRVGSSDGLQDYMTSTAIDEGTHSLVFTPTGGSAFLQIESTDTWAKTLTGCTIEAAGIVSITTPWGASTLSTLRWANSLDVVYVAQYGGQQYKIERRGTRPGARGWSVVKYKTANGPFLNLPTLPNVTLTPSVYEGNGTLTASRPFFQTGHVGALFQLFTNGQDVKTFLGAAGAFTDPVVIDGFGPDRKFGITTTGTWSGTLTIQRSLVGPTTGFEIATNNATAPTITTNATKLFDDTSSGYNGAKLWVRVGFVAAADYTSGAAGVQFTNPSGATFGLVTGGAVDNGGQYGICRVTGYTSPTQVSIEVLSYGALNGGGGFSSLRGTTNWAEGAWSGVQGWPNSVAFHEGRLGWFSAAQFPMALSQSNNYTGFASIDMFGESLGDAGVILQSFGEGPADRVNFALGLQRLLLGREESIASVRSSSFDAPLTPTDCAIKNCSDQGATRLPAVTAGKRGIYAGTGGRVYELAFAPQEADYGERDLTRLNTEIGIPGFVDVALARQTDRTLYLPRGDGMAACLLYDPGDEVEAWWRLMTLGIIENVRRLPNYDNTGPDDYTYFVVKRTVNGSTKRFIEKMAQRTDCIGGLSNQQLDSAYVYSGVAVSSITISWLPSTTVSVWADGAFIGTGTTDGSGILSPLPDGLAHTSIVAGLTGGTFTYSGAEASVITGLDAYDLLPGEFFADQQPSGRMIRIGTLTPSGGSVTLPNGIQSANVVGFFGYQAPFMSAKLAYGAQRGSALTQKKRIDHIGLAGFDMSAVGLQFGQRFDRLDSLPLIEDGAAVSTGGVWSEFDQPMIELPGEYDTDARLCLLAQAPYPAKVGGIVLGVATNEM
jgi:hypothetical protein